MGRLPMVDETTESIDNLKAVWAGSSDAPLSTHGMNVSWLCDVLSAGQVILTGLNCVTD